MRFMTYQSLTGAEIAFNTSAVSSPTDKISQKYLTEETITEYAKRGGKILKEGTYTELEQSNIPRITQFLNMLN